MKLHTSINIIFSIVVIIFLMNGCVAPTTKRPDPNDAAVALEAEKQREFAIKETLKNQQRLYTVGWPILIAGLPLCHDRTRWSIGAFYANKFDFTDEMRDAAISYLDMGDVPKVHTIISESPAALSGLDVGDVILRINDKEAPVGEGATTKLSEIIKEELKEGNEISLQIRHDGIQETLNIPPVKICDYPMLVVNKDDVNAFADGNNIFVNQGMMDFADTDQELSLVVAHELAHNSMRHIDAKKTNFVIGLLFDVLLAGLTGVDFGIRGATANAYSQDFEAEADYVGMYIMARADMEIENAPDFWRRMGTRNPQSIEDNYLASHPSTPERFVSLEDTLSEIRLKQEAGQEMMPNIDEESWTSREPPPSQASQIGLGN